MSSYKIVSYCPDRHLEYDGRTPYEVGVGGGVTARVRMAKALRKLGHQVTMVVNCPRKDQIDGVDYVPLDEVSHLRGDVLILNTSGGDLDLRPALELDIDVSMRIVWSHGTIKPLGLEETGFDYLYAVSNFVAGVARSEWGVLKEKLFVSYNGYEEELFSRLTSGNPERNDFLLVYFSHPSKGLDSAISILKILNRQDRRFELVAYGGPKLWGQPESLSLENEGVRYEGLVGQKRLAQSLLKCSYAVQLQSRAEPFGLSAIEAMRAGCVVLASPVGAYPEYVQDGHNGFLFAGDHRSQALHELVADEILSLTHDTEKRNKISDRARAVPWNTEVMAQTWLGHWEWHLRTEGTTVSLRSHLPYCNMCEGEVLRLGDGYHCLECGHYQYAIRPAVENVP